MGLQQTFDGLGPFWDNAALVVWSILLNIGWNRQRFLLKFPLQLSIAVKQESLNLK